MRSRRLQSTLGQRREVLDVERPIPLADPEVLRDFFEALFALLLADRLVDVLENPLGHLLRLLDLTPVLTGVGVMDDLHGQMSDVKGNETV